MNPWTIPNGLTVIRFGCAFYLIVTAVFQRDTLAEYAWLGFALFVLGCITDWLDGWISRTWRSQESKLGRWIDPPADKLLVFGYMGYLYMLGIASSSFEIMGFAIIILREVFMWAWRMRVGSDFMPVRTLGKWKTAIQMVALGVYGLAFMDRGLLNAAEGLLTVACAITLWSLLDYIWTARKITQ